jgi:DNA-binding CsgD family transcriptional regulator
MTVVGERTVSIGTDSARLRMWALQRGVLPALAPAGFGFELLAGSTTWPTLLDRVVLLSAREMEVFLLLGVGASNRTIASGLNVAERTVKAHVAQVMAKLAVESRLQAGLVSQVFRMTNEGTLSIAPPD